MTDRYAIIGNPIAQAKSPALQTAFAQQCGQDMAYGAILGELDGFVAGVREFQKSGGKGMNITMPFKLEAFELADELTPRGRAAGAINMFTLRDDGTILGDNTDGFGIMRDITHNLGRALKGARVLLLGAGGAVRGTLLPLFDEQPAEIFIANRTASKAVELAAEFGGEAGSIKLAGGGFADISGRFDVIINGSASSMTNDVPPLPVGVWDKESLAYDMAYKKEPTAFVLAARAAGVGQTADGLGMVVEQGAECFFLWRGQRPDTAPVIAALRNA
ncbi:shikimate dehydrogenase [Uliginosibacterium aquaticum]|uniref:Shikimate dehydrogenase (NADP(+)) n=1 Tax=Uliginosibacterium aquaticum TaxID=2731212 RepID=A0ABX2ILT2_9RHOO|nr:shikimate dehydrogenase [Uliginosibacterium aquaticum]NSL55962.1 shikimate dehydrogenase [Uliginosibacterium aquaticum]